MSKKRIIIVHSFKDRGYESRLQQIANNPDLDDISFAHCCIIDYDRDSYRIRRLDRMLDESIKDKKRIKELQKEIIEEEVAPLLDQQISDFKPKFIIVHSGTIFSSVTGPFLTMIINLMEKYPDLKFTLEGKSEWLIHRVGMNYEPFERRGAINENRWVKKNFTDDDEVEEIIKEIF